MSIWSQKSASIQRRTSPPKFLENRGSRMGVPGVIMFVLPGADRWIAFTLKETSNHEPFINTKGTIFFRTDLDSWPFDEQHLKLEIDHIAGKEVLGLQFKFVFCMFSTSCKDRCKYNRKRATICQPHRGERGVSERVL